MDSLISGCSKHQAALGAGSVDLLAMLTVERDSLRSALVNRTESAGIAESATQILNRERDDATLATRKGRDFVYAQLGKHDTRLVEFGLDSLRRRNGTGNGSSVPGGSGESPPDAGGNENGDNTQP